MSNKEKNSIVSSYGIMKIPTLLLALALSVTMLGSAFAMELTNKEKAVAIVKAFETGDKTALNYISDKEYIQHNPGYPDGKAAVAGFFTGKPTGITIEVYRALEDGVFVAVQSVYGGIWNDKKPQVAFDVFRFENGLAVEHWDNLRDVMPPNPSGNTETDGTTVITELAKTEENKQYITNFVEEVLVKADYTNVQDFFDNGKYIQHSPGVADGLSGLEAALKEMAEKNITMEYSKIHYVIGEGDFVLVLSGGKLGKTPTAFYDLLRVQNGKVAEHWDVVSSIPPASDWKNKNGKF